MADIVNILAAAAGAIPTAETDPNFNQTVLLLHGDGTDGSQNNTFLDSSSNNFTITRNGNATQGTFSPFSAPDGRWSNYFDGSGDYLSIANNSAFDFGSGDLTIECWFYLTGNAAQAADGNRYASLFSAFPASGSLSTDYAFNIIGDSSSTGTGVNFNTRNSGSSQNTEYIATITKNVWHHIAITKTSSTVSIFYDGVRVVQNAAVTNTIDSGGNPIKVGAVRYDAGSGNFYNYDFPGYISNVRVLKGTTLYSGATYTVPTSPLTAIANTSLLTCQSNRFVDNSSNAFAITRNGDVKVTPFSPFAPTAAYSPTTNGGSGYFDGSGDHLTLTDTSNDLDLGGVQASVDFWAYVPDSTVQYNAIQKGNSNSYNLTDGFSYALAQSSSTWAFFYNNAGSGASISGTAPAPNQWTHVCAATDTSNNIALFINGTRVATASNAISKPTTRTGIKIGEALSNAGDWSGYMSGLRFLTGANAYDPTDTTITIPTAPPTAVSGTELLLNFTNAGILDNTGKNNLETVGNAQVDTTTKKFGTGSMEFDGTGDYLLMNGGENFAFGTGAFTIEFWLRLNSTSGVQICYDSRPAATNGAQIIIFTDSGVLKFQHTSTARITGSSLSTNTWYHIALVRSGTDTKMYVDGTQVGSTYTSDTTNYLNGANRPIIGADGAAPTNNQLNGFIDDLRITKGVARYTTTFSVPTKAFPDL